MTVPGEGVIEARRGAAEINLEVEMGSEECTARDTRLAILSRKKNAYTILRAKDPRAVGGRGSILR
jgi:hypothetical protein